MSYIPRILLCGDTKSFQSAAGNMAVEIVGEISFTGSAERGEFLIFSNELDLETYVPKDLRIFLNGAEISADELRKLLDGAADYIIFDDDEFILRYNELRALKLGERFITRKTLFRQARHNFYSSPNFFSLTKIIRENNLSRLIDLDGYFAETDFCFYPELLPTVDAVAKNFDRNNLIVENAYNKIFNSLDECRFKLYDALLIAERSTEDFIDVLLETNDLSENILTFARKNTPLEKFLAANSTAFEEVQNFPAVNGNWYLIKKRTPKDFCIYVITYKNIKLDEPPEGYKIIQGGHAVHEDSGYLGDDTGNNISALNPYLNEATVLYWMWKNTSHTIIGFAHYRRFFTTNIFAPRCENGAYLKYNAEDILSRDEAEKILREYDIIVSETRLANISSSCWQKMVSGGDLESFVEKIFLKHIGQKQPEYLEVFKHTAQAFANFPCEIFVTRRNIFNAYCQWLFSFLLDVTEEVFARTNIRQVPSSRKYRVLAFFTERMINVWLRKNRLQIKKLPIMFRENI